jgi:hypothetical protein
LRFVSFLYLSTFLTLEIWDIRGINTANEIAIMAITYKSNPIAMPIEAENHIDAAVV